MRRIVEDGLSTPRVQQLLRQHLCDMRRNSPPGSVNAFDFNRLRDPSVTFWTAWDDEELLGFGALKHHSATHGELKSMRTHPDHLRRGVARAILGHILGVARSRGYTRVSLETGSGSAFEPALALYRAEGFVEGSVFGDYSDTEFNRFFHRDLAADDTALSDDTPSPA